jgi:biotin operon repressor
MKYLVTRIRHVLEGITVDATSSSEAIEKSRKTLRKDWSHLDSKRRKGYKAEPVETD